MYLVPHSRHQLIGVFLVIFAFLCGAIMNALVKVALITHSIGDVLFMQNLWALVLLIPFAMGSWKKQTLRHWKLHLVRAFAGLLCYVCLFIAIRHLSLANATILSNSAPLFLPFVVWVWLKEKISLRLALSLIVGFAGVVFIIGPSRDLLSSWMVLIALLASLFSAIALQAVRNLGRVEPPLVIALYYFFISTVVLIPMCSWEPYVLKDWLLFIGIGACLALTQISLAKAYKQANPAVLGPFNYSVVVFAGIIDWAFWGVIPTYLSAIGIILIVLGGIFSLRESKTITN